MVLNWKWKKTVKIKQKSSVFPRKSSTWKKKLSSLKKLIFVFYFFHFNYIQISNFCELISQLKFIRKSPHIPHYNTSVGKTKLININRIGFCVSFRYQQSAIFLGSHTLNTVIFRLWSLPKSECIEAVLQSLLHLQYRIPCNFEWEHVPEELECSFTRRARLQQVVLVVIEVSRWGPSVYINQYEGKKTCIFSLCVQRKKNKFNWDSARNFLYNTDESRLLFSVDVLLLKLAFKLQNSFSTSVSWETSKVKHVYWVKLFINLFKSDIFLQFNLFHSK